MIIWNRTTVVFAGTAIQLSASPNCVYTLNTLRIVSVCFVQSGVNRVSLNRSKCATIATKSWAHQKRSLNKPNVFVRKYAKKNIHAFSTSKPIQKQWKPSVPIAIRWKWWKRFLFTMVKSTHSVHTAVRSFWSFRVAFSQVRYTMSTFNVNDPTICFPFRFEFCRQMHLVREVFHPQFKQSLHRSLW